VEHKRVIPVALYAHLVALVHGCKAASRANNLSQLGSDRGHQLVLEAPGPASLMWRISDAEILGELLEYEKFTAIQKEFWEICSSLFPFGQQPYTMDIAQCMIAKDEYIIPKMEAEIVKSMKVELLQMVDINQRQKICLTMVDDHGNFLRSKPKDWNEIKNNKFMIINGQHNIATSKELQLEGCGEQRRRDLEKWPTIIVWDLDPVRLTRISKFYNSTNHLNHAKPTWSNQIVSGRNI
jgi:hypothetical protein